ncbi:MAG: hypothetical protein E1N59_3222 [Puniceicoccaceae bacterium 5H]|nr:MAG: hypothetical protein E1N59_3222 [Puniceicoccaceae bacterium 5H]
MNDERSIREKLATWQPETTPDPYLKQRVLNRVAASGETERAWFRRLWPQWGRFSLAAVAVALVLALASFWVLPSDTHHLDGQLTAQRTRYFLRIDPVARLDAEGARAEPQADPSLIDMLDWMRTNFDLTQDQFVELVKVHQTYSGDLDSLYDRLVELQHSYEGFESQRLHDQSIDFIALYQLLQRRDAVREDAEKTSMALVRQILHVLRPEQRDRFILLLNQAHTPSVAAATPWTPPPTPMPT